MPNNKPDPAKSWNQFIRQCGRLETMWSRYQESVSGIGRYDDLPAGLQSHIARFNPATSFSFVLPELVRYWMTTGGVKNLLVERE